MAFVYQGSGKKQSPTSELSLRKCKTLACDIQWCLAKSNTSFTRCKPQIDAWEECFDKARAEEAALAASSSVSASGGSTAGTTGGIK